MNQVNDEYVPVSRETVYTGILPWAGRRYEERVAAKIKPVPHDPRARLVPKAVYEAYASQPQANSRLSREDALRLGIEAPRKPGAGDTLLRKIRGWVGAPVD